MPSTPVRDIELIEIGSLGKETLSNDSFTNLSLGISGAATIPLSSTDHTLTTTNDGEAMRFVLILTGTLTANVNVLVPAESRVYVVDNRTTGAFTVTCRPAAGGGVAVDQSARTLIYCDGANVYPVASGTGGGGGGSGAPTDASYLVSAAHTLLSGERIVTDTATVTWDMATAGQAKAQIPDGAVTYAKLQDVATARLLGRFAAGSGDVQEITPGTGLTLDASGVLSVVAGGGAQPLDATLTALAGVTTGANTLEYFTGVDVAASTPLTPFARTLLDDADQAAMQTTLGVVPGATVQPLDATLTALAGVTTGADRLAFFTGVDTASTTVLTPFMRSLLDDPDQAAAQATLGVTPGGGATPGGTTGQVQYNSTGSFGGSSALTLDATTLLTLAPLTTKGDVLVQGTSALARLPVGTNGQVLTADSAEGTGVKWATAPAGVSTFLGLTDSPDTYSGQAGKAVLVNAEATALEFGTAGAGTFLALSDSPDSYSGQGGKVVAVKSDTTGLEFIAGGGGSITNDGAKVVRTTPSATIANTTLAVVPFESAVLDQAGYWAVGQPTRLVIPTTGWYTVSAQITWNCTVNSGYRDVNIRINGTDYRIISRVASTGTSAAGDQLATGVAYLTAGDYLEVVLFHSASGTSTVTGSCSIMRAGGGEVATYLALTDTPDTYTGQAGKVVQVNAGATATEFGPVLGTMATQNANAVAITGGSISIGGHTPTGVLDVQGSVVATDQANNYFGVRVWPVAPSGATNVVGLRIEPATGAGLASVNLRGITILDPPSVGNMMAASLQVSAGAGRYNVYAQGTAPNYFAGNIGIGTTPDTNQLKVVGRCWFLYDRPAGQYALTFQPMGSDTGPGQNVIFNNFTGGQVGSITTTGSATAYNTSSDVRLKHSIEKLVGALGVVQLLNPVRFMWNADDSPGEGFLAHELQHHIPAAVSGEPDAINEDGSIRPQQVDHSKLVPWLTASVQELAAQVHTLTARVANLEALITI